MCCTTGQTSGTAATMFKKIDHVMTKLQLPWSNCVGFSLDNTSENLKVFATLLRPELFLKNENCYFMGCLCHAIHNTAHKGSVGFTKSQSLIQKTFVLTFTSTLIKVQNERMLYKVMQNFVIKNSSLKSSSKINC